MKKTTAIASFIALGLGLNGVPSCAYGAFLEQFPGLNKQVLQESDSNFRFGLGIYPLVFMHERQAITLSLFQLHYTQGLWDWEVFSTNVLVSLTSQSNQSRHLIFRTVPKFRIMDNLSVGPILGYEFASFPNVKAQLTNGNFSAPTEPFSISGAVLGLELSEKFKWKKDLWVALGQSVCIERYSIPKPGVDHWGFSFEDAAINNDPEKNVVKPGLVFQFEFSILF